MNAKEKIKEMFEQMGIKGDNLKETVAYFDGRLKDSPSLADDVMSEGKTFEGLNKYLMNQASKVKTGNVAMVSDSIVFEWTEDYFRADEETAEAEKPKASKPASKTLPFKKKDEPKIVQSSMFDDDVEIATDSDGMTWFTF